MESVNHKSHEGNTKEMPETRRLCGPSRCWCGPGFCGLHRDTGQRSLARSGGHSVENL